MALEEAERILSIPLDETNPDFVKILSRKSAVIAAVMSTTVRTTAERLRGKTKDSLDDVIIAVQRQREQIAQLR